MYSECCPNCGEAEKWDFTWGESNQWDGKLEPDTGFCGVCGFYYSEHAFHPLSEQLERFNKKDSP